MALLARATPEEIEAALAAIGEPEGWSWLRAPETGLVMMRGRIGGAGAPFNLGEATVTRAAVRLSCGAAGHAHALGRDHRKVRDAALLDALCAAGRSEEVERHALAPIAERIETGRRRDGRRSAATKVDFFTLVRGED